MPSYIEIDAWAKVNLVFEVLGKRGDGYHEVKTVMQTVDLGDKLVVEPWPSLQVECDLPELSGESNLVWQAAAALARARGVRPRARIRVRKGIPVAMGLGGGSSDAAAALRMLNDLWETGASAGELAEIAAGIGSDVPFFLRGGTALAEGRGEVVTPLPGLPAFRVTLVFPDLAIGGKTARMYSRVTPAHYSDGGVSRRLAQLLLGGAFAAESIRGCIYNVFQDIAEWEFPVLAALRRAARDAGGPELYLCGAGPAMFGIPSSEGEHRAAVDTLSPMGAGVRLVTAVGGV